MAWQTHDLSRIIEHAPVGIAITTTDGLIEYANPHLCHLLESPAGLLHGVQLARLQVADIDTGTGEAQYRTASGAVHHVLESIHPLRDDEGRITHFVHFLRDMVPNRLAERLTAMAFHDALTGLPNRNLFDERLSRTIAQARRNGSGFALLYIDIDRFKQVNDALGHAGGDELLRQMAERMRHCLRKTDTVARMGGDEFAIILDQTAGIARVAETTEKLLAQCSADYNLAGAPWRASVSIGISMYPDDARSADELLRRADTAMYHAKTAGRGGYRASEPTGNYDTSRQALYTNAGLCPASPP